MDSMKWIETYGKLNTYWWDFYANNALDRLNALEMSKDKGCTFTTFIQKNHYTTSSHEYIFRSWSNGIYNL